MPHLYKVGELYHPDRTQWPERVEYNYRDGTHELRMFIANLTADEIKTVKNGHAEFGVFGYWDVIFFLYRFKDRRGLTVFEGSCPYTIHLVPEEQRTLPEDPPDEQGAMLTVFLVEATDGTIKAIRVIGLGHQFTITLNQLIRQQATQPFDEKRYDRNIGYAYASHPSDTMMFRVAAARYIARTRQG